MAKFNIIIFLILAINSYISFAQVEHIPVVHPVYDFLLRFESKGYLPHFSLSSLPLQRKEIAGALVLIRDNEEKLNAAESSTLMKFLSEFRVDKDYPTRNAVLIYSSTDSIQVISKEMFGNKEKYIYHYSDSLHRVSVSPLASLDFILKKEPVIDERKVIFGNLGVRLFGTLGNSLGYYLQATNGAILSGERALALEDPKLRRNVKFVNLNSDFDFTDSHVRYDYDWFYAIIGRENRQWGAGLNQRLIASTNAPPFDALSLGAKFKTFEYRFTHGSMLGLSRDSVHSTGVNLIVPDKYSVFHRFAIRQKWGEIALWENLVYSGRNIDIAYLNPLSFLKTLEHALRDRDNSVMGLDATLRPFDGLQLKGTYALDDIIFSEIGKGFWSNKSAWNLAVIAALPYSLDIGLEYSRIEPYTYSHFNVQNTITNDSIIYSSYLLPNSDEISAKINYWWGNRYPISLTFSYMRHGRNIYDESGNLIKNVGADVFQSRRHEDPPTVTFLDGDLIEIMSIQLSFGMELSRGFNMYFAFLVESIDDDVSTRFRYGFRFDDF